MLVPCGKCPKCKQRRSMSWVFRILQEDKRHKCAYFVTLTYAPEHVPITKNGFMTLDKRHYQLFMKRLRKRTGCKTIRYYACGEYGGKTWRPHYHAIIFDASQEDIEKSWHLGSVWIGNVTGASIGYTTKYICKDKRIPQHAKDDRKREFSLMSKNMGINYMTKQMVDWHNNNNASYVMLEGGYKQPLPRYYRDKIFDEEKKHRLNYINYNRQQQAFEKKVIEAGSKNQYYQDRYYAVKQLLHNNLEKNKRDKI